jgi:uracil-DNA glycosylase family 4
VTRTLQEVAQTAAVCTLCRLSAGRTQVVFGDGSREADVMFIGEGPGFHEDRQGIPFVGAAGQLLNQLLAEIGLERGDVYITNVVLCRPPGNRDPLPDEIHSCRPYLMDQLELVDPRVIVTLGNFATRVMLDRAVSISRIRGQRQPWQGRVVIPTYHPAAVLRGGGDASHTMRAIREDFATIRAALAEMPAPLEEQLGLF